jgi:hypothetical protein
MLTSVCPARVRAEGTGQRTAGGWQRRDRQARQGGRQAGQVGGAFVPIQSNAASLWDARPCLFSTLLQNLAVIHPDTGDVAVALLEPKINMDRDHDQQCQSVRLPTTQTGHILDTRCPPARHALKLIRHKRGPFLLPCSAIGWETHQAGLDRMVLCRGRILEIPRPTAASKHWMKVTFLVLWQTNERNGCSPMRRASQGRTVGIIGGT